MPRFTVTAPATVIVDFRAKTADAAMALWRKWQRRTSGHRIGPGEVVIGRKVTLHCDGKPVDVTDAVEPDA
jgi:hypothetical protein